MDERRRARLGVVAGASIAARRSGFMQSGWAIGYAAAVLVSGFVQPRYGWRAVFFIGILPALFTLWVRRRVKEPAIWTASSRSGTPSAGARRRFSRAASAALTIVADADEHLHAVRVVGLQSLAAELPEVEPARRAASVSARAATTGYLFVMQAGMWFGYVTFGFVSDRFGRKKTYVTYLLSAAVLLAVYVSVRDPDRRCWCSDRSSRSPRPGTSAASAR